MTWRSRGGLLLGGGIRKLVFMKNYVAGDDQFICGRVVAAWALLELEYRRKIQGVDLGESLLGANGLSQGKKR